MPSHEQEDGDRYSEVIDPDSGMPLAELANMKAQSIVPDTLLSKVASESLNGVIITERSGGIVYVNRAFELDTGYSLGEILGRRPGDVLQGDHTNHETKQRIRKALDDNQSLSTEVLQYRKSGEARWYSIHMSPLVDDTGEPTHFAAIQNDITERKLAEERLAAANRELEFQMCLVQEQTAKLENVNQLLNELATTDGLTELKNHRTFQERLADEFRRATRYDKPLSILLLDVDRFKVFNDTFGHPAGDIVLKQVAALLRACARDTDLVARYGGEEFVVILPETDREAAFLVAERIRHTVECAEWPHRAITVSIGISTRDDESHSASHIVEAADRALYHSKHAGRNRSTHHGMLADTKQDELHGGHTEPYSKVITEMMQIQSEQFATASDTLRTVMADTFDAVIITWARMMDLKDREVAGHSERIADLMLKMAYEIGMNPEERLYARWGSLLHDVGNMGVPDEVLHKRAPLTDQEWIVLKSHANIAHAYLHPIAFLRPAIDIPHLHHERWDGSGYPLGLTGDEIPLAVRLFAIADVYDSLTNERPYRLAWSHQSAVDYIVANAGSHFDPRAVKVFQRVI